MQMQMMQAQAKLGMKKSPIEKVYDLCKTDRSPFLGRAETYASYTLPAILSSKEGNKDVSNKHGFDDTGAQATNSLANRLAVTLFPVQQSFFSLDTNSQSEQDLAAAGYEKTQLSQALAALTRKVMSRLEGMSFRTAIVETFKHLIITGNALMYLPAGKEAELQCIPLTHYVIKRDISGNILKIIVLQEKAFSSFDSHMQALIQSSKNQPCKGSTNIKLYTCAKKIDDKFYEMTQCLEGGMPVGEPKRVRRTKVPFIPVVWRRNYGENYGRGLVEDHEGDFYTMDILSRSLAKGLVLMSDIRYLVKQGAILNLNELKKSKNGDAMYGNDGDVTVLQLGKYFDSQPLQAALETYKQRIGQVFLLASLVRRDAERVTAYEIRTDALEIEQNFGGAYSMFSGTMQRPLAQLALSHESDSVINGVDIIIQTGLSALGQMAELQKLDQLSQLLAAPTQWMQGFQQMLDPHKYLDWALSQLSFEAPFFLTQTQVNDQNEDAQLTQQTNQLEQEAMKAAPDLVKQQLTEAS